MKDSELIKKLVPYGNGGDVNRKPPKNQTEMRKSYQPTNRFHKGNFSVFTLQFNTTLKYLTLLVTVSFLYICSCPWC